MSSQRQVRRFAYRSGVYASAMLLALRGEIATLTANVTNTILLGAPVHRGALDLFVTVMASAVPADADGTLVATVKKWDASAGAAVSLSAATDLETLITAAKKGYHIALLSTLTEEEVYLDTGDSVYVEVVSNSAAINTNANLVFQAVQFVEQEYPS